MNLSNKTVNRVNLLLGLGIFAGLWIVAVAGLDETPVHEGVELALTGLIAFHLLLNGSRIAQMARDYFGRRLRNSRLQFAIDSTLMLAFVVMVFARLTTSGDMLAFTGAVNTRNSLWNPVHNLPTYAAIFLGVLHLAAPEGWAAAKS